MARPQKLILPTKEELEQLYHGEKLSLQKICEMYNVSNERIRKEFIKHGISRRKGYDEKEIPEFEELEKLAQKLSKIKIAKHFNVSATLVSQWLNKYGIKCERKTIIKKLSPPINELECLYNKTLSKQDVAAYFKVDISTIDRWFKENSIKSRTWKKHPKWSKKELIELHHNQKWSIDTIATHFKVDWRTVKRAFNYYHIEQKIFLTSKAEIDIHNFLKENGFEGVKTRKILNSRKELDFYSENHKIAIEYCGLYWHSEAIETINRQSHYSKWKKCTERNIQLLTIFEDEWLNKTDIVKSIILSKFGFFHKRYFARKLVVKSVEKSEANLFFEENHLQGKTNHSIAIGLYEGDELLGCMSFGKHHRGNNSLILNRLAFKKNVQIIGGATKLFSFFTKAFNPPFIISWSDNRWSTGSVYAQMGFELDSNLPPDYSYVNNKIMRRSKQSMKKSRTNCPDNLTEKEWNRQNGWFQIWDCGKKRWLWKKS